LRFLSGAVSNISFEEDLLWFIPAVFRAIRDMSPLGIAKFILDPAPALYGPAVLKAYTVLCLNLFGPSPSGFVSVSLLFHAFGSFLLFSLCRNMGLGWRKSTFSAIIFLGLYIHFGAYIWPMAFQHLVTVFFMLLVLSLYLKTGTIMDGRRDGRAYYAMTIAANLAASFARASILMLPVLLLFHIAVSSRGGEERARKFRLWSPLFITYLVYPLFALVYGGDDRMNIYLAGGRSALSYALFFAAGLAALILTGPALRLQWEKKSGRRNTACAIAAALFIIFYFSISSKDIRNILLPYNVILPFAGMVASFLGPVRAVLSNDPSRPYYFVSLAPGFFYLSLAIGMLYVFFRDSVKEHKGLLIFVPWYLMSFIYINLREPVASRYFIYLSPAFCVIAASVFDRLFFSGPGRTVRGNIAREIVAAVIIAGLVASNIAAIRLDLLRGRLANNFPAYDRLKGGAAPDGFDGTFSAAMSKLKERNYPAAKALFDRALAIRPFLLNYVLPGLELEDLKWIMNAPDMKDWINKIVSYSEVNADDREKAVQIGSVIDREVDGYIECLFCASYLSYRSGDGASGERLFSRIQFLESDYGAVSAILERSGCMDLDGDMRPFLNSFNSTSLYTDVPYRNTFEFERFLFKLLTGRAIVKTVH